MAGELRVGIVGANPAIGWGSGVHARAIGMLPGFTLEGVCTTRAESASEAKRRFGAAHAFTDAAALAHHPEIDIVAICVKAPHHHAIAREALIAGKHVYCEWPLALTVAQAEELAAMAAARGRKAMIGLHMRGAAAMRTMAGLIADGFVGEVRSVNLHARLFGPLMRPMAQRAGGTTLLSIYGGHLLDAIDHYFGGVAAIAARQAIHLPAIDEAGQALARDAADHLLLSGALHGGALFSVDLGGFTPGGFGTRWRIDGSAGSLILSTPDPSLAAIESLAIEGARAGEAWQPIASAARHDNAAVPPTPDRYSAYPGSDASRAALVAIANLYGALGDAIRHDRAVEPDFARAAAVQTMLAAIDEDAERSASPAPAMRGAA